MAKESNIQKKIMLAASKYSRVFRNNVGIGWTGNVFNTSKGDKLIKNARPLRAGLCTGSSDLIGWTEKIITPDMVGKNIAIFTAIEVKTDKGRASKDQLNFIEQVNKSGGIAGVCRSENDVINLINNK